MVMILNNGRLGCLVRVSRQSQWAPGSGDHCSEPSWSIGNTTSGGDDTGSSYGVCGDDNGDDNGVGDGTGDGDYDGGDGVMEISMSLRLGTGDHYS